MKTRTMLLAIAALAVFTSSCNKEIMPSGNITQESHNWTGFQNIDASDAFEVYITSGDPGVVIEADDNIHQYIDARVSGDRLYLGVERRYNFSGPATLKAYVSIDGSLKGLYASGASLCNFHDVSAADNLQIEASGASNIIGDLNAVNINAYLSGASRMNLTGEADAVNAYLSGASSASGLDLTVNDLVIELSGASNATCTVNSTLNVKASGASSLLYKGSGSVVHQELSGASYITKLD